MHLEFAPETTDWLPGFRTNNLEIDPFSLLGGIRRGRFSFFAGYSRFYINLGVQNITDPTGPDPIAFFNSEEHADILTLALRRHGEIEMGLG